MHCEGCGVVERTERYARVELCEVCYAEQRRLARRQAQAWQDQYDYLLGTLPPLLALMVRRQITLRSDRR